MVESKDIFVLANFVILSGRNNQPLQYTDMCSLALSDLIFYAKPLLQSRLGALTVVDLDIVLPSVPNWRLCPTKKQDRSGERTIWLLEEQIGNWIAFAAILV